MNGGFMKQSGFTLAELLVTIAILALLMAIALPSYAEHVRKARRSDAQITLQNLANAQETYFFQHNEYATKFSSLRGVADSVLTIPSEESFYEITMIAEKFSWSLSARATGAQADDHQCASFTLTHLGIHTAEDAAGKVAGSCW